MCSSRFCLDNQSSLNRDQVFARLQSRLIRYETQTTCSKERCALPFALSPAPSPAVMSEPGSVPDGETLQNSDVAQLKRKSRETDIVGGYPRKRYHDSMSCFSAGCGLMKTIKRKSLMWNIIFFLSDQGWWSRRAATPCVLRAAAAAAHGSTSGVYNSSQSDPSPPQPLLAPLKLQGERQVTNLSVAL